MKDIILMLCSLMGRFNQFNSKDAANNTEKIPQNLGSVNHRLNQIKKQLASVENRVMYKPLRQVSVVLIDQKVTHFASHFLPFVPNFLPINGAGRCSKNCEAKIPSIVIKCSTLWQTFDFLLM